ncbi:hypothetical protein U1Q18_052060 [Sarracenia purpurea var. burkii]
MANALLYDGISTYTVSNDGTVRIQRVITTYQTDPNGAETPAFLDLNSPLTLAFIRADLRYYLATKYPRSKLADDGTNYGVGQAIVTPSILKGEIIAGEAVGRGGPYSREIRAKGDFTWNLGQPKNESVIGAGSVHGYKSTPQVSFVEGALTDTADVDLIALTGASESTIIVELPNSKSLILRQAYWAGDGEGTTAEGEFKVRGRALSGGGDLVNLPDGIRKLETYGEVFAAWREILTIPPAEGEEEGTVLFAGNDRVAITVDGVYIQLRKPLHAGPTAELTDVLCVREPTVNELRAMDRYKGETEKAVALLTSLCNIPNADINKMPASDFRLCDFRSRRHHRRYRPGDEAYQRHHGRHPEDVHDRRERLGKIETGGSRKRPRKPRGIRAGCLAPRWAPAGARSSTSRRKSRRRAGLRRKPTNSPTLRENFKKTTTMDDEFFMNSAASLAHFGIRTKQIKALLPALSDYVADQAGVNATSEDGIAAAKLIGKAWAGNTGALRKQGIILTKAQELIIKHGTAAQKTAVIIRAIEGRMGGMGVSLPRRRRE